MDIINYPRHFAYLALAFVALMLIEPLSFSPWPDHFSFFFGLFGALHALAVVTALRAGALLRRVIFIVMAAALSACVPYFGLVLPHVVGVHGAFALYAAVAFASAVGSLAYWALVRAFWLPDLVIPDAVRTVSFCVSATILAFFLVTLLSGFGAHHSELGDALPTVLWWYAFSYSLWVSKGPAMAANSRWRGA